MSEDRLSGLAATLGGVLARRRLVMTTAESCTGGWVSKLVTDVAGSSEWFDRGFVTYSNAAKVDLLGVDAALIRRDGAVSEAVVLAMAAGALRRAGADIAVAITGVAGPGGGSDAKPVGTVWLGWASPRRSVAALRRFPGGRDAVRRGAVAAALEGLLDFLDDE